MAAATERAPTSLRAQHASVRKRWAQRNNNLVAELRERTMKGAELDNFYRKARKLVPIRFDLLHPDLLDPDGTGEAWEPPKRAKEFIGALAQVLLNWEILDKEHPHYGEPYSGFELSAEQVARSFGISARQWYRGPTYYADGRLRNKPGTRAWLMHTGLLGVLSTTSNRPAWWRNRQGKGMPHGEDMNIYVAGPKLEALMKLHRKRARRSRRRAVNDHKRAVLAKRLRKLALRRAAGSTAKKGPPGNSFQPKACVVSSSLREEPTNTPTPRGTRQRVDDQLRQLTRVSPVGDGVGGQGRRRKAPAAPPADRRHDRCSSPQQTRNEPEPDGHEGPGFAKGGGELEAPRQAAPLAFGEAERDAGVAAPPAAVDAATSGAALVPVLDGEVVKFDLKRLISATLRKVDPDQARREALYGPAPPPKLIGGHQGELPGTKPETLLAFTDPAELIGFVQSQADERFAAQARWKRKNGMPLTDADKRAEEGRRHRGRDLAAGRTGPGAALGSAFGELLGVDRTPEERAENERRREQSKRRARRGANADVDFVNPDDEQRDENPDDDDGGAA